MAAAAHARPFRFGTVTTAGTDHSRRHWAEHARRVEAPVVDKLAGS